MKITLKSGYDLQEQFAAMDRDYFSIEGYDALLEYYDEIDQNIELDVIAICCETTEYSNSALHDFQDLINDYCQYYDMDDYCEDNDIKLEDVDEDDYIHKLIEKLEENTTVLHLNNNGYIIFEF